MTRATATSASRSLARCCRTSRLSRVPLAHGCRLQWRPRGEAIRLARQAHPRSSEGVGSCVPQTLPQLLHILRLSAQLAPDALPRIIRQRPSALSLQPGSSGTGRRLRNCCVGLILHHLCAICLLVLSVCGTQKFPREGCTRIFIFNCDSRVAFAPCMARRKMLSWLLHRIPVSSLLSIAKVPRFVAAAVLGERALERGRPFIRRQTSRSSKPGLDQSVPHGHSRGWPSRGHRRFWSWRVTREG